MENYTTIRKGLKELESEQKVIAEKIRACGGRRKCLLDKAPNRLWWKQQ